MGIINIHDLGTHMQIKTQPFKEIIEIKNTGIAFDVYNGGTQRIGDLAVTKNGLVWNKGANGSRSKGVTVKWDDFISWMQTKTQPLTRTRTPARALTQSATAAKAKIAAKPANAVAKAKVAAKSGSAIAAKKPATKIAASAKTAGKKAH